MNLSRRSFAKALSLVPVFGPMAAKAMGDAEIARLAGVATSDAPAMQYSSSYGPPTPLGLNDNNKARIAAADYVKLVGLPDFVKKQIRRNSQYVSCLDPDLAAKRSWSMAVKIATQRERNYERQLELFQHTSWVVRSSSAFKKLTGWDWPL